MTPIQKVGYVLARIIAPVLILALGVGGLIVFGQKPEKQEKPRANRQGTIVEVVAAEQREGGFPIEVEGVALPLRQVQTSARVAGIITQKSEDCRGGKYVNAGDVLIQIDPTDYQLDVARLQAQLDQADESLAEVAVERTNTESMITLAEEDVQLQQRSLQRVQGLFERGATTDTGLDEARKPELTARNALQTLQNQLRTQQQREKTLAAARELVAAQLERAKADVERAVVRAPVSGTIVTTDVEQGDYVKVGDPLFRTNDTDDMEVSCQLRVEELYWIWLQEGNFSPESTNVGADAFEIPNTPVQVAYEFKGVEYLWDGELSRYDGTGLDPLTRTIPCRVLVKEPTSVGVGGDGVRGLVAPPTLFSGMYVKVRIPIEPTISLIQVPTLAVQPGGEIWLAREGALDIEQVQVARIVDDLALLLPTANGPKPGEWVITSPLAGPTQGMEVTTINPNSPLERAAAETAATAGEGSRVTEAAR